MALLDFDFLGWTDSDIAAIAVAVIREGHTCTNLVYLALIDLRLILDNVAVDLGIFVRNRIGPRPGVCVHALIRYLTGIDLGAALVVDINGNPVAVVGHVFARTRANRIDYWCSLGGGEQLFVVLDCPVDNLVALPVSLVADGAVTLSRGAIVDLVMELSPHGIGMRLGCSSELVLCLIDRDFAIIFQVLVQVDVGLISNGYDFALRHAGERIVKCLARSMVVRILRRRYFAARYLYGPRRQRKRLIAARKLVPHMNIFHVPTGRSNGYDVLHLHGVGIEGASLAYVDRARLWRVDVDDACDFVIELLEGRIALELGKVIYVERNVSCALQILELRIGRIERDAQSTARRNAVVGGDLLVAFMRMNGDYQFVVAYATIQNLDSRRHLVGERTAIVELIVRALGEPHVDGIPLAFDRRIRLVLVQDKARDSHVLEEVIQVRLRGRVVRDVDDVLRAVLEGDGERLVRVERLEADELPVVAGLLDLDEGLIGELDVGHVGDVDVDAQDGEELTQENVTLACDAVGVAVVGEVDGVGERVDTEVLDHHGGGVTVHLGVNRRDGDVGRGYVVGAGRGAGLFDNVSRQRKVRHRNVAGVLCSEAFRDLAALELEVHGYGTLGGLDLDQATVLVSGEEGDIVEKRVLIVIGSLAVGRIVEGVHVGIVVVGRGLWRDRGHDQVDALGQGRGIGEGGRHLDGGILKGEGLLSVALLRLDGVSLLLGLLLLGLLLLGLLCLIVGLGLFDGGFLVLSGLLLLDGRRLVLLLGLGLLFGLLLLRCGFRRGLLLGLGLFGCLLSLRLGVGGFGLLLGFCRGFRRSSGLLLRNDGENRTVLQAVFLHYVVAILAGRYLVTLAISIVRHTHDAESIVGMHGEHHVAVQRHGKVLRVYFPTGV